MTMIRIGLPYSSFTQLAQTALSMRAPALISMGSFYRRSEGGLSRSIGSAPWYMPCALDSAGFSAMVQWGGYPWSVQEHVNFVRTNGGQWEMPMPWQWWAAMDYCCEQAVAHDRQQVLTRMRQTIESAEETLAEVDYWIGEGDHLAYPLLTLQGRTPADYLWSVREISRVWRNRREASDGAQGMLLPEFPRLLGVGSVCTRPLHGPEGLLPILSALHAELPPYVRLHLFGVKGSALDYLPRFGERVESIDSMAWDLSARKQAQHKRKSGAFSCDLNHRSQAMREWYAALQQRPTTEQMSLL